MLYITCLHPRVYDHTQMRICCECFMSKTLSVLWSIRVSNKAVRTPEQRAKALADKCLKDAAVLRQRAVQVRKLEFADGLSKQLEDSAAYLEDVYITVHAWCIIAISLGA